jgi:hypothetical protein
MYVTIICLCSKRRANCEYLQEFLRTLGMSVNVQVRQAVVPDRSPVNSLKKGEYGCYVSHERALEEFLNSPHDTGMTFEDDIGIASEDEARVLILRAVEECRRAAEVINLDPNMQGVSYFGKVSGPFKYTSFPMWNLSAVMYTKSGARKLSDAAADNIQRFFPRPIDHMFRPSGARCCYVSPTPFFQNKKAFVSELRRDVWTERPPPAEIPIPDFIVYYWFLHGMKVVIVVAVILIVRYRQTTG